MTLKTKSLAPLEQRILIHTYQYRCSTYSHLYHYLEQDHTKLYETINWLIQKEWLIKDDLPKEEEEIYFLTTKGLNQIKKELETKSPKLKTAAQLRLKPAAYHHHVATLDFMLAAQNLLEQRKINHQLELEGWGERYYPVIPDGVIRFEQMDLIVEMDMGTERLARLKQKMTYYGKLRERLKQNQYPCPLKVFFVFHDTPKPAQLKAIYTALGSELLTQLGKTFDFIIGTRQELLKCLEEELIPFVLNQPHPTKEEWRNRFDTYLLPKGYHAISLYSNVDRCLLDWAWVKQGDHSQQFQHVWVNLTALWGSRLKTLAFLPNTLPTLVREAKMSQNGQVYVLIKEKERKRIQTIFTWINYQPQPNVHLVTTEEVCRKMAHTSP